jgi:hypothetical protein
MTSSIPRYGVPRRSFCEGSRGASGPGRPTVSGGEEPSTPNSIGGVIKNRRAKRAKAAKGKSIAGGGGKNRPGAEKSSAAAIMQRYSNNRQL